MAGNLTVANDVSVGNDLTVTGEVDFNGGAKDTDLITNLNADQVDGADKDTDTSMAADSDDKIPSQKAVKAYIDTKDAQNVKLTGNQTIGGNKTLTGLTYASGGLRIENRTDDPGSPSIGQMWIRTDV